MTTPRADRPIGVFDSGIGGLTVVRALRKLLPEEAIVYLGDTARVPYGNKSHHTIERYALQAGTILARYHPKLMVIACNSASAHGLAALQAAAPCPVIGVIEPGAEAASAAEGPVGVIGTLATVQSGAYEAAIRRRNPEAVIHSLPCPLLVGFAEEGWLDDPITDAVCRRYLNQIPFEVRTIVLGCTHYPILLPSLTRTRPDTTWLDSGELTARAVEDLLRGSLGFRTASARGDLRVLLTDAGTRLQEVGQRFLGEPVESVELVGTLMFLSDALSEAMVTYLTGTVANYQRRVPNDLERLRAELRPGDVLLVEGDTRIAQLIKYLTQSSWSHATMYLGDALLRWGGPEADKALDRFGPEASSLLIESDLKEGVRAIPLSAYLGANLRICRPQGLRPGGLDRVLGEMLRHLGVRYDQRNVFDLARYLFPVQMVPRRLRPRSLYLGSSSSREVICSALIAKAFYKAGLTIQAPMGPGASLLFQVRHPSYIMPRDFDLSANFQIIKTHAVPASTVTPAPWND